MASRRTNGHAQTLDQKAAALLKRGDVDGYRALFGTVAELEDERRRYAARCALVRAVLSPTGDHGGQRTAAYTLAAREAFTVLEENPREPVLLNQAGVLLALLECYGAAQVLFEAAKRLDPELANVDRNLAEVVGRRRVPQQAQGGLLGELAPRALQIAERARPAEGMTVSLCMIVKDEEEMLPRCLAAAAPAVDEIVVVDTGSSDRTIEIARSFGARVIERAWTGDFSAARNVAFDAATCDWMLVLDADEVLVAEDVSVLRELLGKTWREAFYVTEINYTGELDDGTSTAHTTLRLFRNRPHHRYSGRLHEQILDSLPTGLPERFEASAVRIEHYGYLGAVRDAKEKSRRNVELLLRQLDESGESAFMRFNLGSEYAEIGDTETALEEFERCAELLGDDRTGGFVPTFVSRLVRTLRSCGREQDAIDRAERELRVFEGFTDLVFEQAVAAHALGRVDEAIERFERCIEMGDAPSRYTATVGMGSFLPTIALAEIWRERGDVARAGELLDACLAEHPGFFGLVLPFASALLAVGSDADEVVRRVETRVAKLTPTVRFMLGTALYEHGATVAAEEQYRQLLQAQPGSSIGCVALAEALLSQRRWSDAVAVASQLQDGEPHAPEARRSELFALLAAGELEAVSAILARGDDTGLAGAELDLFAACRQALAGEEDDGVLSAQAAPLLSVLLEALLRVEEFDVFGALVPLVDRLPVAPREQREVRAGIYLRRGFLASAAEEWMAVIASDPADVRALVGIAQAAAAQGMADEALDFAREAHALDPEDARAATLLQRLEPAAA